MFAGDEIADFGALITHMEDRSLLRFDGVIDTPLGPAWLTTCVVSLNPAMSPLDRVLIPRVAQEGWVAIIPSHLSDTATPSPVNDWDEALSALAQQQKEAGE